VRTLKAKEDKNLDSQAKTNSLFVVSESGIEVTLHTCSRALTFKLNVRNDAPSVIDARSCVPFEPQKLEFSSTCQNFIELPRCQLESHTQSVLNGRIKKVTRV
jgi:hypothetical protein